MKALYYIDSSAWVKRYFAEAGSTWMHALFSRESALASSALAYVEVAATLARRTVARQEASVTLLPNKLKTEWNTMLQFEIDGGVLERAVLLAWEQKLRGADSIHLACAIQLRDQAAHRSLEVILVAADAELIRAAQERQLVVTNPAQVI